MESGVWWVGKRKEGEEGGEGGGRKEEEVSRWKERKEEGRKYSHSILFHSILVNNSVPCPDSWSGGGPQGAGPIAMPAT